MKIHISTKDGVPIFQQIVTQIKHMVASGRLAPGEIVPPIRVLAEQLLINPNTVARAYKELESEGIFISRQGSGTRVAEKGSTLDYAERLQVLTERVESLLVEADQLDFTVEDIIELIRQKNKLFYTSERGKNIND
ncbi:MAG: GntR family transcriptional regulator [Deltaproteobacteria bacterium]|nr:GntR family transcriptional regulator [Deltaproteobacteria bacterium]